MNMDATAMEMVDYQARLATHGYPLEYSIHYFLREYPKSVSVLSKSISVYRELIEDLNDPPLEIVWFYGALVFHKRRPCRRPPPGKLSVAEDLLELVKECASLCSMLMKVAMIAPVVYHLYHLEVDFSGRDPSLRDEIGIAVEGIVSYISICCSQFLDEGCQGSKTLGAYILDLIRIWMVHQVRDIDEINVLSSFFPSLPNEFQADVTVCLGYLAGAVMNETLLLRLCLKISPRIDREDLQRNLLNVAIQTIKGFQNFYFLDMLLKMLSGPNFPVAASMSYENALLLRKVLYDATILVEYSFHSGKWVQSFTSQSKKLALAWLIAADQAIQFARDSGDQYRTLAYLNAFRECQLVAELINWVSNHHGLVDPNAIPDVTNPKALIKWLLVLDSHGVEVFDHSMMVLHAKAVACVSSNPPELTLFQTRNLNVTVLDLEESDESGGSLVPVRLATGENDHGRKRKESLNGLQEPQVKQVKLDHCGGSVGGNVLSLSSGSGGVGRGVIDLDSSGDDDDDDGDDDDDMDLVG